jgi:transposase
MHTRDLSDFERGMIVGLHLAGKSERQIGVIVKIDKSTVYDVITAYNTSQKTTVAPRTGRQLILNERDTRQLIRTVKKNRKAAVEEITKSFVSDLNISVSKRTV